MTSESKHGLQSEIWCHWQRKWRTWVRFARSVEPAQHLPSSSSGRPSAPIRTSRSAAPTCTCPFAASVSTRRHDSKTRCWNVSRRLTIQAPSSRLSATRIQRLPRVIRKTKARSAIIHQALAEDRSTTPPRKPCRPATRSRRRCQEPCSIKEKLGKRWRASPIRNETATTLRTMRMWSLNWKMALCWGIHQEWRSNMPKTTNRHHRQQRNLSSKTSRICNLATAKSSASPQTRKKWPRTSNCEASSNCLNRMLAMPLKPLSRSSKTQFGRPNSARDSDIRWILKQNCLYFTRRPINLKG